MFMRKGRNMKQNLTLLLIGIAILIGWPYAIVYGATTSLTSGVRYDMFHEDSSDGFEITLPVGFAYEQEQFVVQLETSYGYANVEPEDADDTSFSAMTDTHLAISYLFLNLPVSIRLGLDANLPTGKERLNMRQRSAEAGERNDLFEIDDFGEGLNIGTSLGLVKEFDTISLLVDGAYIFNGEFDPTSDISDDDLDPGEQVLVIALFNWQMSPQLMLEMFGAYSYFFKDQLNGKENFREGGKVGFGGSLRVERKQIELLLSVQQVLQSKDEVLVEESLKTESENSNGFRVFGIFDFMYHMSPKLSLELIGDLRYYEESERTDELYGLPLRGRRVRYAVGPGAIYTLNKHLTWNGLVKYFHMEQERDIILDQETTYQGVNLAVGITYTF